MIHAICQKMLKNHSCVIMFLRAKVYCSYLFYAFEIAHPKSPKSRPPPTASDMHYHQHEAIAIFLVLDKTR